MSRALVIIHIYYSNQVDLILDSLKNISLPYDLYCSITNQEDYKNIKNKILKFNPNAHIVNVANIGYDVWPFVHIIGIVDLSHYEYIIKLHTKRDIDISSKIELGNGFRIYPGNYWRDSLYAFISSKDNFNKCIQALKSPKIGMCTRFNMIHNAPNYCGVIDYARSHYPQYVPNLSKYCFVAGTMFIAKAAPFQILKNMNIREQLFEKPVESHKTQLAHIIERMLGEIIYKSGMIITDPFTPRKHIRKIKKLYSKGKWIKRLISYITIPIPIKKIRRKIKSKLFSIYYTPFMNRIIEIDNGDNMTHRHIKSNVWKDMTPVRHFFGLGNVLLQILFYFNKDHQRVAQEKLRDKKKLVKKAYKIPDGFDHTQIPVFIISYNQLSYVKQMVNWLKKYRFANIHIVDNNSSYKPLLDYLDTVDCHVHHMGTNYGHTVIWSSGKFDYITDNQCYIVSDCDIAPNPKLPKDFVRRLYELLGSHPYLTKVGFALNIKDLPKTKTNKIVQQWEKQFWEKEIDKDMYLADIDTTFALYRPGKLILNTKQFYYAIRVAGDMTAIHLPWFETKETEESSFYKQTANSSASWTKNVEYYEKEIASSEQFVDTRGKI